VLDTREAASSTRDRLKYYFQAKGTSFEATPVAKSNIYLGSGLCK
jgi:hypothetical protein